MCDYILNSGTNSFNLDLMFDTLLGLSGALNCFIRVPRVFPLSIFTPMQYFIQIIVQFIRVYVETHSPLS